MAARVLDDVLNNFLSVDIVLSWLSNFNTTNDENVFLKQYECNQIEFVSNFLVFLRDQSSRDFQVYDVETPRKNSHLRVFKSYNSSDDFTPRPKTQDISPSVSNIDLESLQSFPTLSSSSSKLDTVEKKLLDSTPNLVNKNSFKKDNSEKKFRRVKLFSETVGGLSKMNSSNDFKLLDEEVTPTRENKFTVSTPKHFKCNSLPITDYLNTSDIQDETSPNPSSKHKLKNLSLDLSNNEINFLTPKNKSFGSDSSKKCKNNKSNCRASLGDFILVDFNENKKEKKNKAKKKLTPVRINTQVTSSDDSPFHEKCGMISEYNTISASDKVQNFKLEIEKNKEEMDEEIKSIKYPSSFSSEKQAELEQATHTEELKILSQIYSCLIDENYCQNIMMELCFIVSLLVIQDHNKKFSELDSEMKYINIIKEKKFFGSIHNCVFFAVETLWLQRNLLLLLNLSSLKLLSENVRIEKFNVNLKEFLVAAYSKKQSTEEIKRSYGLMKTGMQGNVSFQYETDNQENFTSTTSFHSFKKQRDLFYSILTTWEVNHLTSGWVFSNSLGSKIRTLFSISSDPINLLHLARLFRDQLIMSCCAENQSEQDINEDILQLLPSADPNKILRLRARLTSSSKRQGPCPPPDFTGHQEFYKEFILCANHSTFHEHLKNSLCDEILRLNDTEPSGDIEDDESCLDEQTQERYFQCTNILRVLSKFLGYVEFLPYRTEKPLSDRILNIHCSVRYNTLPLFDVVSCLKTALTKKKLILTVPWVVTYMSMIDPYSTHLKPYQDVWQLLVLIYRNLKLYKTLKNSFYLKLILGWVFQLPVFPQDQFYSVLNDCDKNLSESLAVSFSDETKTGSDSYNFVNENILYSVCPYLNEINVILSENLGCSVRHIRPVTTQENSTMKSQASKQLELRLESNFLHNQTSSTRKTVEFVTERIASVAIKYLINSVIPKFKEASCAKLESGLLNVSKEAESVLSEICYNELLLFCEKENWKICFERSKIAVSALLSNDLQGPVADTCAKIVARQATEKVQRWMQSHVTLAMVKKKFFSQTRKHLSKTPSESNNGILDTSDLNIYSEKIFSNEFSHHLPSKGRGVVHSETAYPASQALKTARELIRKLYEGGSFTNEIEGIIDEAVKTLNHRNDLIPAAERALFFLLVDLIVCYCVLSDNDIRQETFIKFNCLLTHQNFPRNSLERVICPRNAAIILNKSKNKKKAWQNLGNLLLSLLEEDFLTKEQVETQLLSLLRQNWEKEEGIQFSNFISHILYRYSESNGCDKFSLLLECMLDSLNDDEPKSESFG